MYTKIDLCNFASVKAELHFITHNNQREDVPTQTFLHDLSSDREKFPVELY